MKKTFIFFALIISVYALVADSWTQKANFPGTLRSMPLTFTIGNNAYVTSGRAALSTTSSLGDLWEYNQPTNTWSQKANFPGTPRVFGMCFSIGGMGYVGCGLVGNNYFPDIWQFDPVNNTWTQKNDFTPGGRYFPLGFAANNNGYIGLGIDSTGAYRSELWQYDVASDSWTAQQNFPAQSRAVSTFFTIGTKAYAGMGYIIGQPSSGFLDFWEFDVVANTWTQVASFPGTKRTQTASFSIGNMGYVGLGNQLVPNTILNDLWQYNPSANQWTQKLNFGGTNRDEVAFCSINGKGYVGLGWQNGSNLFGDWWEYSSDDSTTAVSDAEKENACIKVFPNPATDHIYLESALLNADISITDIKGRIVYTSLSTTFPVKLNILNFASGVYTIQFKNDNKTRSVKFVKQ